MSKFLIDEPVAQNLLTYLIERPFKEVWQLVSSLQTLVKFQPPEPPEHIVNYLRDQVDELNHFIKQSKLTDALDEFRRNRNHSHNDEAM